MIDYAPIQARGKGEAPITNQEGGYATAKALNASPLPTADGVDMMYRQLAKIHAISAAQLMMCAGWRCFNSTPNLVRAKIG
jgi:hypothetical protein